MAKSHFTTLKCILYRQYVISRVISVFNCGLQTIVCNIGTTVPLILKTWSDPVKQAPQSIPIVWNKTQFSLLEEHGTLFQTVYTPVSDQKVRRYFQYNSFNVIHIPCHLNVVKILLGMLNICFDMFFHSHHQYIVQNKQLLLSCNLLITFPVYQIFFPKSAIV